MKAKQRIRTKYGEAGESREKERRKRNGKTECRHWRLHTHTTHSHSHKQEKQKKKTGHGVLLPSFSYEKDGEDAFTPILEDFSSF